MVGILTGGTLITLGGSGKCSYYIRTADLAGQEAYAVFGVVEREKEAK